jgi:hypothetical protein
MTELMHTTKRILTAAAVALTGAFALPQSAAASNVGQLALDAADIEARLVSPLYMPSAATGTTGGLRDAIYAVEAVLDFSDSGFSAPASARSTLISTYEVVVRTETLRNTLVARACAIANDAAPFTGRFSSAMVATRIQAVQLAMQMTVPAYVPKRRVSPVMAENALSDISDMMFTLSEEGAALGKIDDTLVSTHAINLAVDDIYYRAAAVCDAYPMH